MWDFIDTKCDPLSLILSNEEPLNIFYTLESIPSARSPWRVHVQYTIYVQQMYPPEPSPWICHWTCKCFWGFLFVFPIHFLLYFNLRPPPSPSNKNLAVYTDEPNTYCTLRSSCKYNMFKLQVSEHLSNSLVFWFIIISYSFVNFHFLYSNKPLSPAYDVYISQLIRYARACYTYEDFQKKSKLLTKKLMLQDYRESRLKSILRSL